MIDIERKIFTVVSDALTDAFPGVTVSDQYTETMSAFPAVTIAEMSNTVIRSRRTAQRIENGATLMYECNVFSNKKPGKKAEAKEILAAVDEQMAAMGFTRTFMNPIPNINEATIYRVVARYEAAVLPESENSYRVYTN